MAPLNPVETKKFFSVTEANRALPLVKRIVADIVAQWQTVSELRGRLSALLRPDRKRHPGDVYEEELAHSQAELEIEEEKMQAFADELTKLGVELKGPDSGLCDFPALKDGREVYLCWKLGEPEIQHWHEVNSGFSGRQPLATFSGGRGGRGH